MYTNHRIYYPQTIHLLGKDISGIFYQTNSLKNVPKLNHLHLEIEP